MTTESNNIGSVCAKCASKMRKHWQRVNLTTSISVGDFVKIGLTGKGADGKVCSEHLWVEVMDISHHSKLTGVIKNIPVSVTEHKFGDEISFKRKKIEDYWARTWYDSYTEELIMDKQEDLMGVAKYYGGGCCYD